MPTNRWINKETAVKMNLFMVQQVVASPGPLGEALLGGAATPGGVGFEVSAAQDLVSCSLPAASRI